MRGGKRLGTAFHESFSLVRPALASVLEVADSSESEGTSTSLADLLKERTALGANYIKSMPQYARGSGLFAKASRSKMTLTTFGKQARLHDPHLNHPATQWLMHYHLSSLNGPGPSFWNHLITRVLRVGDGLERSEVAREIARIAEEETGKPLADRTAQSTATVFLKTYTKSDGFGPLGVLRPIGGDGSMSYRVQEPTLPPAWTVAYALADYWEGTRGQQATVNLTELTAPGGLASVFLTGPAQLERLLEGLREQGVLDLYRTAPPYQVVRLWTDKNDLLKRIYE